VSAITNPDEFVDTTTAMALEEKAKLQKHFTRFDIYFFLICTIVGVDTLGLVAAEGAQGFTWLIFLAIFFFVPYALLTAELGSAFPEEGGAYVWTRLAFGRLVAAVNAIFYWFSNPIWIGATLALLTIATVNEFFFSIGDNSWLFYLVGLAYIWFSVYSAILSFGIGKWIPTLGAWARIAVLGLFVVSTVLYAFKNGLSFPAGGEFKPTYALFIALVPVLFFNYVGFELPSAAGDEMKDPQKDVPYTVLRAAITAILLYGLPILAVIAVLPKDEITGVDGFMTAVAAVFSVYGGAASVMTKIAAFGFILALISSACTWLMGSDRSQAVACYDGAGPRVLGRFSAKLGTPVNVNFLSGVISTIVFVAAARIAGGNASATFDVMIGIVLTFTTISYIVIFPALIKLRYSHAHVNRPYKIPGGMAGVWICGVLTTFWAVFASLVAIFPGFLDGKLLNDAGLPEDVSRAKYTTIAAVAIGIAFLAGFIFYWLGGRTREHMVEVPLEGNEELAAEAGFTPA
jgi:amino acid transporter